MSAALLILLVYCRYPLQHRVVFSVIVVQIHMMNSHQIRKVHSRVRDKLDAILKARENILELAQTNFPNSDMVTYAQTMLAAAHRDRDDMEQRIARIDGLFGGEVGDGD